MTDANGNATQYAYDARGDLIGVTDALGHVTAYDYDLATNRTRFTNGKGNSTLYTYDALNRLLSTTNPLSLVTSFQYDANGNLIATTDAKSNVTRMTYDQLNRLLTRLYADGDLVTYSYDASGNRTKMVDATGTTLFAYDLLNRVTAVTYPDGRSALYGYDGVGNRILLTYPDGKTITYAFDANNRMAGVTDWVERETVYGYDAAGNVTSIGYPNETTKTFAYDAANRLTRLTNAVVGGGVSYPGSSLSYLLDAVGNPVRLEDGTGRIKNFLYDPINELTGIQDEQPTTFSATTTSAAAQLTTFTYDAAGNRITKSAPDGSIAYSYDAADRLLSAGSISFGNISFGYDNNGNRVAKTQGGATQTYSYNAANRLITVANSAAVSTFVYDGNGNRVRQTVTGLGTYNYVNDLAASLVVVFQEAGPDGNISYTRGRAAISASGPGFDYFYDYDRSFSVIGLTDANGALVQSYGYDPWGSAECPCRAGADPNSCNLAVGNRGCQTAGTRNKFRYIGEALDPGTGLYYLRARYYDPTLGRFISQDPFPGYDRDPITRNLYIYSRNNPLRFTDRTGLDWADDFTDSGGGTDVTDSGSDFSWPFAPDLP